MQKTKHEIVIEYIESLDIGEKVSVRQLARQMNISEGTVYRAIKEAENQGLVSSIPKVGTIRIEQEQERSIDSLTYRELSNIVEGELLHGKDKSDAAPKAFFVASSVEHLRDKKPLPQTMIIGEFSQELIDYVYDNDLPIMLTGDSVIAAKNRLASLPDDMVMISTPYDIFDAIIAINQAIVGSVQQRELVTIADIMTTDPYVLQPIDTVGDWQELSLQTGHREFPVVDAQGMLEGMVTAYDIAGASSSTYIEEVMTPNPVVVHSDTLVSYLGRLLVLEQVELVPVVDANEMLLGVVSLKDFIEAQQTMQKQPHLGDTSDNICMSGFSLVAREPDVILSGRIIPYMLDEYGSLSMGTANIFSANAAVIALRVVKNLQGQPYQVNTRFYNEIGAEEEVYLLPELSVYKDQHHATVRIETLDGLLIAISDVELLIRDN
ncbi:MAG: CBS domain-containing protein [Peptococcaceae bacterium]|nr:CBS domain-containing protein [Peptococcaceae bacterium]